ncbi:ABC transporter permease [Caproiciproducens sp. CPB-2]|uniref:ABC transporter permease n=1 Tax=Caproiciproducens sp. CPB-2 TaxID=3030017 RepID=UPI0023DA53B4|nr:ABC transporter permease [Caproiciproducens sp. CPB-2]MDF1495424.1 ABC transporter permease [Caproiciproducens sp. CPB-2]
MFQHLFTARLKCLIRDRQMMFWTLLFPLLLATFFNMALSNLNNTEAFHPIDIAVVDNDRYRQNKDFQSVLEEVSQGEDRIFNLTKTDGEKAKKLLDDGKIKAYVTVGTEIGMTVRESGLSQNIVRAFLNSYSQTSSAVASIVRENPASIKDGLIDAVSARGEYTREVSGSSAEPNNVLNYFYSLIAMSCLYGGFLGLKEVADVQADLSQRAARVNVAPVHKLKIFLYNVCAAILLHFSEMLVLLAYLYFGLKIDFGPKSLFVLLTTFAGSVLGVSFGAFVSALVKKGEGIKVAVLLAVSMAGSFLAGMMFEDMKYIVAQNAPVLSYLNPVNLLTDAFYSLYYYDVMTRYGWNMAAVCAYALLFCLGSYFMIRRQKYASL